MRDEVDAIRPDFRREPSDDVDDSGRDSIRMVVRRRHDRVGHDGAAFHVEGNGFRERPTDVDADSNRHDSGTRADRHGRIRVGRHTGAPSSAPPAGVGVERRNCGRSTNMYNAPTAYTVMSASCAVIVSRLGQ